ncbi:predicted protein [Plenodomus lingam JN3]|uniref:Predicted protein n=1 Tax=Leptosphaeria maculans (strain JN3 / isolate v23.1.3 / race Av1-4-5-6-7-8) TaxID=985895 RepID=E4ZN63_LEPMJ|nr:predicted protein [Plenodomus lingam JN3]CBX92666.1 predicted protein [Plenodomus lingam JN3]
MAVNSECWHDAHGQLLLRFSKPRLPSPDLSASMTYIGSIMQGMEPGSSCRPINQERGPSPPDAMPLAQNLYIAALCNQRSFDMTESR